MPASGPHVLLREAARKGDLTTIYELLYEYPDLDLNDQDPVSGRTALHEAYYAKKNEVIEFLASLDVDIYRTDKNDFFPIELAINPHPYDDSQYDGLDYKKFYTLISEENAAHQLNNPASTCRIFYISRIEKMNSYIKKYPDLNRIGFIVLKPNAIRSIADGDYHVIQIYYERHFQQETVVQLDSKNGQLLLIPQPNLPQTKRTVIYSPFKRQAVDNGCFEDALELLGKLINMPPWEFIDFCRQHSKIETDFENITNFTIAKEDERYNCLLTQGTASPEVEAELSHLEKRVDYFRQACVLQYQNILFVSKVYKLSLLHPVVFLNIERFDTMRYFRVHFPQMFSALTIKNILENGVKRDPFVPDDEIANNFHKEDKRYDVAGPCFFNRREKYARLRAVRNDSIFQAVFTIFSANSSGGNHRDNNKIAGLVANFSTGLG